MKLFLSLSFILFIHSFSYAELGRHSRWLEFRRVLFRSQINIGGGYEVNKVNNILNNPSLDYTLDGGLFSIEFT